MRILLLGPVAYPYGGNQGYGGVERLVWLFGEEMARRGKRVVVAAPVGSWVEGCGQVTVRREENSVLGESEAGEKARDFLPLVDVILDFTHNHELVRRYPEVPNLSVIWHDPRIIRTATPKANVVALSEWQARRFRETTGQEARVVDCVCADPGYYFYDGDVPLSERRFLSIGIADPRKGHLEAARMAKEAGVGLDMVGPPHDEGYVKLLKEAEVQTKEGNSIRYWGEAKLDSKRNLMWRAKALIYAVNFAPGMGEAHSMKMAEALMVGLPCLTWNQGAMREVFGGFAEVAEDMDGLGRLVRQWKERSNCPEERKERAERAKERFSVQNTVARWMPVLESVAKGEKW